MGKLALSMLLALALVAPVTAPLGSQEAYAAKAVQLAEGDGTTAETPTTPPTEIPAKELTPTQISGLITEKALLPTMKATNAITVAPAYGRTVELQKQLASGNWKTVATYTTANAASASVKLTFPASEWKTSKYTIWRVNIPETQTAQAFTSENALLYTRNRVTVSLNAKSAVVMNASTGRVLYSKNRDTRRGQASITKVMTTILAIERNKLTKKVKITRTAANTPWTYVPMKKGNRVTVKNLLYASLLPSSNGSATALAQATSGTTSRFVKLMNKRAKELGLANTHYANPHGLTQKGHYSSAYDTAVLMSYAMKNKTFRKIVGTRKFTFVNSTTKKRYKMLNTNRLLRQNVKGVVGGKTGTTDAAGCCFTCVYERNGQTYITVVLGCKYTDHRFNDTKKLISYIKKYGW